MKSVRIIYFSPTGTTKKVVETIAGSLRSEKVDVLDLTPTRGRRYGRLTSDVDLTILGVPVYTGRVPFQVVEALQQMQGPGTPAAIVVVYGNRAYEDALLELNDIVSRIGFLPIAAAAFVGEHSFSTAATPIAVGRPDNEDLEQAASFGRTLRERLEAAGPLGNGQFLKVPGNYPYRERAQHVSSPETVTELCTKCGACEAACPEEAIAVTEDGVATDRESCLLCCACVRACPTGARRVNDVELLTIARELSSTCHERRSPEFFMK
ncbi:MAG TPA: 4Fe-4S ferredoxin [Deltaproteobacteria bacterium]|nr:4Fe-4S ferredoxin [Deltaproteobacteria bacterium]